jgi:uncharacterized protein YybS (DUF2232 family)
MTLIFWGLLVLALVFSGAFIYQVTRSTREFRRLQGKDEPFSPSTQNEVSFFLLRWALTLGTLTAAWGIGETIITALAG